MLPSYLSIELSSSTGVLSRQRRLDVDPTHTIQTVLAYLSDIMLLRCPIENIVVKNAGKPVSSHIKLHQLSQEHNGILKLSLDIKNQSFMVKQENEFSRMQTPDSLRSYQQPRGPQQSRLQPSERTLVASISSSSSNILDKWLLVKLEPSLTVEKLLMKLREEGKLKLPVDEVTVLKNGLPLVPNVQLCMLLPQVGSPTIGLTIQPREVKPKQLQHVNSPPRMAFQPSVPPIGQPSIHPSSHLSLGKSEKQTLIESNTTAATINRTSDNVRASNQNFDNFLESKLGSIFDTTPSAKNTLLHPEQFPRNSFILDKPRQQLNPQLGNQKHEEIISKNDTRDNVMNHWQTINVEEGKIKLGPARSAKKNRLDVNSSKLIENVLEIAKNPTPDRVQRLVECWDHSLSDIDHKQSSQFEAELLKNKSGLLGHSPVLLVGKALQAIKKAKVSYSKSRTPASRFTMLHLTTRLGEGWGKGEYRYEEDCGFSFEQIANNRSKLDMFVDLFKKDMAQHYSTIPQRIIVTEIAKGSIHVKFYYETGVPDGCDPYSKSEIPHLKGRRLVKEELLFSELQLSEEDFNSDGDINFVDQYTAEESVRGLFPYYQPAGWIRYGLNIQKYGANQAWLGMQNLPGQWAVMYHGVLYPKNTVSNANTSRETTVVKSIVNNNLKVGERQAKEDCSSIITKSHVRAFEQFGASDEERTGNLGKGVYGTPLIQTAEEFTRQFEVDGEEYLLAFQCRVRPDRIRFTSNQPDYWLVNEPEYIRPYGILLTKSKVVAQEKYQTIQKKFSESYEQWLGKPTRPQTEESEGDF